VSDNGTRRAIREYECLHGLPQDGKIGKQLAAKRLCLLVISAK
jgi:hypothetical protein